MNSAFIQTYSGLVVDLLNPDPFLLSVNDIAHALSNLCRFGGHTKTFYSVANHSVLVSMNVSAADAFVGLMHDAAEAYCQDLVYPLKALLPAYRDIEDSLWEALAFRYRLPYEIPQSVKDADAVLLATEIRDVVNISAAVDMEWKSSSGPLNCFTPLRKKIYSLSPTASRSAFLKQFHALKGR
jgi:5'-deoxynucleotidase YfbR-like HD superfamily hydrolase